MQEKPVSEVRNQEIAFDFDELFFSCTDERGIIRSGNSVFQRISLYEWDELLGKPHNIIRHPDMPKTVFWLLWETIQQGKPIGAYVKNKAKDGRYYWVFAIITPIEGGYLSVRLKPSSDIFHIVEAEYKGLLAAETPGKEGIPETAGILLARLAELGFSSYETFMAAALSAEIKARSAALDKPLDRAIQRFEKLTEKSLNEQAKIIFTAYAQNEYVPLNLRVHAAQLGMSGATIDVISNNYDVISAEIKENMDHFVTAAKDVSATIDHGLFLVCTAAIQQEVLEFFMQEENDNAETQAQEMNLLKHQETEYRTKALEGLHRIAEQSEKFQRTCAAMQRLASALEVTRIMAKVETAHLNVGGTALSQLIDDLEGFQQTIGDGLRELEEVNRSLVYNSTQVVKAVA